LGLFGPALLKLVKPHQRAAHFLAVGDAARRRGANLDKSLLHLEDDHSDHLRRIFGAVEQLRDVGRENVARPGKNTHSSTPQSKNQGPVPAIYYTRRVPKPLKWLTSENSCIFPAESA